MDICIQKSRTEKKGREVQNHDNNQDVRKLPGDVSDHNREVKELIHVEASRNEVKFSGMDPELAKRRYLDKAGQLEKRARELKNKANSLERTMNGVKDIADKEKLNKEILSLRKEAKELERQAEGYKRQFKDAISFKGGLGISNIEGLRASGLRNDARNLRLRASSLESQAHKAENDGDFSKAASLKSEASRCRSEANSKDREASQIEAQLEKKKKE